MIINLSKTSSRTFMVFPFSPSSFVTCKTLVHMEFILVPEQMFSVLSRQLSKHFNIFNEEPSCHYLFGMSSYHKLHVFTCSGLSSTVVLNAGHTLESSRGIKKTLISRSGLTPLDQNLWRQHPSFALFCLFSRSTLSDSNVKPGQEPPLCMFH